EAAAGPQTAGNEPEGPELDRFTGRYQFGDDWFAGRTLARVENRRDHLVVVYLDGSNEGYEFLLVPLGGNRFFDRTHGGTVRFEGRPEGGRPALVYVFGSERVAEPVP
ncbi:MAG TPA: hypothetical protein VKU85_09095, partial [bacterium]|nr:hypothetical protein [bacterium]